MPCISTGRFYFCRMKFRLSSTKGKILLHSSVWLFLFLFPMLIFIYDDSSFDRNMRMLRLNWMQLLLYGILFYFNYLWLIRNYFFTKRFVMFAGINLTLLVAMVWANDLMHTLFFSREAADFVRLNGPRPPKPPGDSGPPPFRFFWLKSFISLMVPTIVAIAVRTVENWFAVEEQQKEAGRIQLESELQHLRYQIQPHFFFNSLNNIYSLVEISPQRAQEAIHGLSKMMRYLLYETSQQMVGLNEEIRFIVSYIELMKLRQTNKTKLGYSFPESEANSWQVAPLLFIPLIENAFKHGVSATKPSEIRFEITLTGGHLRFTGANTNYPKVDDDKSGSGIGLTNLRKRLDLLYPNQYELSTNIEGDQLVATLRIPLMPVDSVRKPI